MTIETFEDLTEIVLSDKLTDIQVADLVFQTTRVLIYPYGEEDIDRNKMLRCLEKMLSDFFSIKERPLFLDENKDF